MTQNLSDIKKQYVDEYEKTSLQNLNFPTEKIQLPTKGKVYPENHPLHTGEIEVRYMTAADEDILSTDIYLKKGVVLDKLFESLIMTKVNYSDICSVDKDAIMMGVRIMSYGSDYKVLTQCSNTKCGHIHTADVDLNNLTFKPGNFDIMIAPNIWQITLPVSKRTLHVKLLTQGDLRKIQFELDEYKKSNKELSINKEPSFRLQQAIISVDGDSNPNTIKTFIEKEFFTQDVKAFRKFIRDISPSIDMTHKFICPLCSNEYFDQVELGVDFFYPDMN